MTKKYIFKDPRLNHRAQLSFGKIIKKPGLSFPQVFNQKELTGFYRLINNSNIDKLEFQKSSKNEAISSISSKNRSVVIAHDTTVFKPKAKIESFFGHFSIALDDEQDSRFLYGPIAINLWHRNIKDKTKGKEYRRWIDGIKEVECSLPNKKLIHLMDREGDSYEHFCELQSLNTGFVIRGRTDKKLFDSDLKLHETMDRKSFIIKRSVQLSKRKKSPIPSMNKTHPPREVRTAKLGITAEKVKIKRPMMLSKKLPEFVDLNIVWVKEIEVTCGERPICWVLITSEKINKKEEVEKVVDLYRKRWLIEEFFKALKSGCKIEHRQFEGKENWYKLVYFLSDIAVKLVNLRRLDKIKDLSSVISYTQQKILKKLGSEEHRKLKTPIDYKYEIAKLGGHIRYNGPPGWIVLARGLEELITLEKGWLLFNRCDK